MSVKRFFWVIVVLIIGCQQAGVGVDSPVPTANDNIAEVEPGRQLKINKNALLEGPGDQIRIDAATVMLFNDDPPARKTLLAVLRQSENAAARTAVCRALVQARGAKKPINDKEDFIQPLVDILASEQDSAAARLAAEATLIFGYEQVAKPLEKIVSDSSLPAGARLNAIEALKLQPDKRAIFRLMNLLDDPDKAVAEASEKALQSLGIPVAGKNAATRRQIRDELERKGRDEFLRDWLIRQDDQIRRLEKDMNLWRELYLAALDKIYDSSGGDEAKSKLLAEYLGNPESAVKLWALKKLYQGRVGTGTESKLPAELEPILVGLVSDQNRDIRLRTANLLSLTGYLNLAQQLAQQHKIEQDDEVRTELFVALGGACYYGFLPNSGVKVPPEIRKQTLEWAVEYLCQQDRKKAQKGAEVIKKLLEQDGLTPAELEKYLGALAKRYTQEKSDTNGLLRADVLNAMAGLCAQSVYKTESAALFEPLFAEALKDKTDLVREAAVEGLIYVDKTRALKTLRQTLVNDSSAIVRKRLIELAGEVGGQDDLAWLAEKIAATSEGESAWQVMLKIFRRSDAAVLDEWVNKFDSQGTQKGLSDEQMLSFLEVAERKSDSKSDPKLLKSIRERLAELYTSSGKFEQAATYLGLLHKEAQTAEEKEAILIKLLEVYLKLPNIKGAKDLVGHYLLEKDVEPNSIIVQLLDNYLSQPAAGTDPNVLLDALAKIEVPDARAGWGEQMKRWEERRPQDKANGG